jgi:hypothetical protein
MAELINLIPETISWTPDQATALRRGTLLGILFDAASPLGCGGPTNLHPIWAAEAMNRTKNMCQLAMLLEFHRWSSPKHAISHRTELACANQLAAALRLIEIEDGNAMVPCAELVSETCACLVELFRPTLGGIRLSTACERITLSACRRRALILTAMELVTQTLFHAFDGSDEDLISVSLSPDCSGTALLLVEDSGAGLRFDTQASCRTIGQLGSVLGAEIAYHRSALGGTATMVWFSV